MNSDDTEYAFDDGGEARQPPAPSVIGLRVRLKRFQSEMTGLRDKLAQLMQPQTDQLPPALKAALAAVAAGQRIPPEDPEDSVYRKWLEQAPVDKLISRSGIAVEEIDSLIGIVGKGLASLHLLNTFDKPMLPNWSNLPPECLARAINSHALIIFQSAIVR